MNLKQQAAKQLATLLKSEYPQIVPRVSDEYFEVRITSSMPVKLECIKNIEQCIGMHAVMLGVSSVGAGIYRVWGKVFEDAEELANYKKRIAAIKDHKALGKSMQLFDIKDEAPGSVFWASRGLQLRRNIEALIDGLISDDYHYVKTPPVLKKNLWQSSGHLDNFADSMCFVDEDSALKPMNCPAHMLMFGQQPRHCTHLPIRFAEYGEVHRNEPSGALSGLLRLRVFTQDDGHIFCEAHQIRDEVQKFIRTTRSVYAQLGFTDVREYLSTRPEVSTGEDADWEMAECALRELGLEELSGEGAFYGPKVELHLGDAMGRRWQCGTIQVDCTLPKKMRLRYTDARNEQQAPVVLHRAILGSIERFIAILLEHHQGWLPWVIAPHQVGIIALGAQGANAESLQLRLRQKNIRSVVYHSLHSGITQCVECRIPQAWILGDREAAQGNITVRHMRSGEQACVDFEETVANA